MPKSRSDSPTANLPSEQETNQKRTLPVSPEETNQQRTVGMFKDSSDFDHNDRENPFTKMASNPCGGRSSGPRAG